jgi:peptide-methionine (S)-S-oxide reductase
MLMAEKLETATLAAGCFWCVEAVFSRLRGVKKVISGYTGGTAPAPTYEAVCSGSTGHAEAVQISFDPEMISFAELLEVFWHTHDPTTLNRQGADSGTQYRSAIFFHDERQREIAEKSKRETGEKGLWPDPIVTEIVPFSKFFEAEEYHQDYYRLNAYQSYCRLVIDPKIRKLQKEFADKLKAAS